MTKKIELTQDKFTTVDDATAMTLPICHHLTQKEMDLNGITTCGIIYWLFGTTSWEETTCPHCLATRAVVCTNGNQLQLDMEGSDTSMIAQLRDAGHGTGGFF